MATASIPVKFLINKKTNKILYMEAGKEFVDLLFSFLTLPPGTVMKLLSVRGSPDCPAKLGSLVKMYESILKLPDSSFVVSKNTLLNPRLAATLPTNLLLLEDGQVEEQLKSLFRCPNNSYSACRNNISTRPNVSCPDCQSTMSTKVQLVRASTIPDTNTGSARTKGYVQENLSFMITDDLSVTPLSTVDSVALLAKYKPDKIGDLESSEANVGADEALELLRVSFYSQSVLNDVFTSILM